MAELSPNFINPDYASPAQIAQLRAYAQALQEKAISGEAKTPMGAIAAALMGFQGAREMGKVNKQEQEANREFSRRVLQATSSKDPSQIMSVMADPRAQPLQALLIGKLMEWGPEKGVTLPSGLGLRGPTEPWFNQGPMAPPQRFAPPTAAPPVTPPAATPSPAVPPTAPPSAETSSVGDIVPGSRTTTGSPDSAFDVIGKQYGVPNLGALNRAGMQQAAEMERMKTGAALAGTQAQTQAAQAPMISSVKQRIVPAINTVLNTIQSGGAWPPLTGSAGYVASHYPGTPAYKTAKDIQDIEDMITSQHVSELTAANPNRRIFPEEIEAWKRDQGLDITDRPKLIKNLQRLQREYGGTAIPSSPITPQGGQGPFPAQAAESPGGVKILKVIPYGGQ